MCDLSQKAESLMPEPLQEGCIVAGGVNHCQSHVQDSIFSFHKVSITSSLSLLGRCADYIRVFRRSSSLGDG